MDYKDNLLTGIAVGLITPLLGWLIVPYIFDLISNLAGRGEFGAGVWRPRTLALVSLCCNLIPFQIAKVNRYDKTLRGITFPTIIFVAVWFLYFKSEFLGTSY